MVRLAERFVQCTWWEPGKTDRNGRFALGGMGAMFPGTSKALDSHAKWAKKQHSRYSQYSQSGLHPVSALRPFPQKLRRGNPCPPPQLSRKNKKNPHEFFMRIFGSQNEK
jgi:hypothetical protein